MHNEKWLTDVTEFKWYEGPNVHKLYLSAILDLYDRRIVAFVIRDRNDNPLVFDTLDAAIKANPTHFGDGGGADACHSTEILLLDVLVDEDFPEFLITNCHRFFLPKCKKAPPGWQSFGCSIICQNIYNTDTMYSTITDRTAKYKQKCCDRSI